MAEEILINENIPIDKPEPLPFPFNQRTFCRYVPIEKRIEEARVLVLPSRIGWQRDLSRQVAGRRDIAHVVGDGRERARDGARVVQDRDVRAGR